MFSYKETILVKLRSNKPVIVNVLIGIVSGYFLLHPVSMVIYWFEFNESPLLLSQFVDVFVDRLSHAFKLHMFPMAMAFAVLGGLLGIGPGLFIRSLKIKQLRIRGSEKLLQKSIPSLIKEGENQFVEFKSSLRYDYRLVKTEKSREDLIIRSIAGFLNAEGGILIIGVDNDGEVLGLHNDYWSLKKKNNEGFHQRLIWLVSNRLGKDVSTKIHATFHQLGTNEICGLFIEPAKRPVYVSVGNETIFYLRSGNVTNSLTTSETVDYLKNKHEI
ncbi:MAG: ATP-binding protein [Gammaproteobacteria bacterium]|nr:MAG: ATP-binding protein [Gammaproteobacteria bacterium]